MIRRIVAAIAALAAFLLVLVNLGSTFVREIVLDGSVGWLPMVGTAGQTALFYLSVSNLLTFVLGVLVVAALGYWAGQHLDVTSEYPSLAGALAGGGAAGFLLGVVPFAVYEGILTPDSLLSFDVFFGAVTLLGNAAGVGIRFLLIGLAGAALAEFGFDPLASRREESADKKPADAEHV